MERREVYTWNGAMRVLACLAVVLLIARTMPVTGQDTSPSSTSARPLDAIQGISLLGTSMASLSPLLADTPTAPARIDAGSSIAEVPTVVGSVGADLPVASVAAMVPGRIESGIKRHWALMRDVFVPVPARELDKPRTEPRPSAVTALPDPTATNSASTGTTTEPGSDRASPDTVAVVGPTTPVVDPIAATSQGSGSATDPEIATLPDFHEPVVVSASQPIVETPQLTPAGSGDDTDILETEPPTFRPKPRARLPRLTGVMISSDRDHMAILDGTIVRAGDFCSGFRVRKITRNSVVLKGDGEEHVVYVNP